MTREECYTILEIPSGSDAAAVRAAYKRMAKKWHPDMNGHPGAKEAFQRVQRAYSLLIKSYLPMESLLRKAEAVQQKTDPREALRRKREMLRRRVMEQKAREKEHLRQQYLRQMGMMLQKNRVTRYRAIYLLNLLFISFSISLALFVLLAGSWFIGLHSLYFILLLIIGIGIPNYFAWRFVLEFSFLIRGKLPANLFAQ